MSRPIVDWQALADLLAERPELAGVGVGPLLWDGLVTS